MFNPPEKFQERNFVFGYEMPDVMRCLNNVLGDDTVLRYHPQGVGYQIDPCRDAAVGFDTCYPLLNL